MTTERSFSWRYATAVAIVAAVLAVAVTAALLVVLAVTGNRPFAGSADATILGVAVMSVVTPLLSCLVAFTISVFTAKQAMGRHALAAMGLSLLFDVAFGVPAAVPAIVLTA